jgi:hypothetical protein
MEVFFGSYSAIRNDGKNEPLHWNLMPQIGRRIAGLMNILRQSYRHST